MKQTMGKRITENRKRLGMTQDKLAELLGVTAQAVSKWENDQSCPDIAMLPRLAEIFGISTDELLGMPRQETVHEAQIVDDEESENEGFHVHKGNWEFKWDSGRRGAISFAVLVLLVGTLTLLSRFFSWGASFWDVLWPSALLVLGLDGLLRKFSFVSLGFTLFGGCFLVSNLNIWTPEFDGELVFPIIVVLLGISLLVDALRKPKKPRFSIRRDGKCLRDDDGKDKKKSSFSVWEDGFECSLSFGEVQRRIDLPRLSGGTASSSFGDLTVDLSGCEEVSAGCRIKANCSFGELRLLVPRRYRVNPGFSTAFADLTVHGEPDAFPTGIIELDGNVSFGAIEIQYI